MTLAIVNSLAQVGTTAPKVSVEVFLSRGLPSFSIVGLPETVVKESKDRVRCAIINSGFEFPNKRISVNLAPADLPKEGGRFDLPIALGVLCASGQLKAQALENRVFLGELALGGQLRKIRGALIACLTVRNTHEVLFLPEESANQAAIIKNATLYGMPTLIALTEALNTETLPAQIPYAPSSEEYTYPDLSEIAGNEFAKLALEIAASGGHSMLMIGSPGSGKTMLAQRFPGLLPNMSEEEALELASIESLVDANWEHNRWRSRPFRSPHHSASTAALIGGGSIPRPGEISRAHNGVLFLDELTEFHSKALDSLREPLESGVINISRAAIQLQFPCKFQFLAAANPCRCGYLGDPNGLCQCTPLQVARYLGKLSGPLLDRIDVQVKVDSISIEIIRRDQNNNESSDQVRQRVINARQRQWARQGKLNCELDVPETHLYCQTDQAGEKFIQAVFEKLKLSMRGYHRILKLARTIADSNQSESINREHLSTAMSLRHLDRMKSFNRDF